MSARTPVDTHTQFREAFNAQDLDKMMSLYEPEAVMIAQPGEAPLKGTKALREALAEYLALKGKLELKTRYVLQAGDLACLSAEWQVKGTGPDGKPVEMSHRSTEVVRRQADGTWKYVLDHPFGSD